MKIYEKRCLCVLFHQVEKGQAIFHSLPATVQSSAEGYRFIFKAAYMDATIFEISPQKLKEMKPWEDMSPTERVTHKGPLLGRDQKDLALMALQRAGLLDTVPDHVIPAKGPEMNPA